MELNLKRSKLIYWSLLCLPCIACLISKAGAANSAAGSPGVKAAKVSAASAKAAPLSAYEKGAAAFARKDYMSALSNFEIALNEHPDDPTIHYGLASVFTAVGNQFQAKCFYQSCISLAPGSKLAENAKAGLAYLDKPSNAATASANDITSSAAGAEAGAGRTKQAQFAGNGLIPPLPAPTPGRYTAPDQQIGYASSGAGSRFGARHGRQAQYGYQSYGYYGAPHIVVRNYSFPPSNTMAASSEPSQVELLAKQSKLVVDEKHSR